MQEAVIVSAARTAIGSFTGGLSPLSAVELGAEVIKSAIARTGVEHIGVEEVIMGNVLQAGTGQNPARQAAVKAGLPLEIPSFTVNHLCGSGLSSINLAAKSVMLGETEVVVAGGMESMSNAVYVVNSKVRQGCRMGDMKLVDSMLRDGLLCAFHDYHMGITAENIAEQYGIRREEQDMAAWESQQKAVKAIENGAFAGEIVPVVVKSRQGEVNFAVDEYPRRNTTLENLAKLKPAFKKDGTVTAGNASGINDGAAAVVVMSAGKARKLGIKPLAKIRSFASAGVDPAVMGLGPIPATRRALAKAGLTLDDIDLIEANEAFAAQFLAVGKELRFEKEKVNVHGGAIALGHPIGASGARVLTSLIYAMQQRKVALGLVTLCIGGGQGVATIVEACS